MMSLGFNLALTYRFMVAVNVCKSSRAMNSGSPSKLVIRRSTKWPERLLALKLSCSLITWY